MPLPSEKVSSGPAVRVTARRSAVSHSFHFLNEGARASEVGQIIVWSSFSLRFQRWSSRFVSRFGRRGERLDSCSFSLSRAGRQNAPIGGRFDDSTIQPPLELRRSTKKNVECRLVEAVREVDDGRNGGRRSSRFEPSTFQRNPRLCKNLVR